MAWRLMPCGMRLRHGLRTLKQMSQTPKQRQSYAICLGFSV